MVTEIVEDKPLTEQNTENNTPEASHAANTRLEQPNLPRRHLLSGPRAYYLKTGVPLYEASIKCDWKAAKKILHKTPNLVRCSITENGETALHVAASAKIPKLVDEFVNNLVDLMGEDDLALENENFNTALYLAAVAGNVETVKIMVKKNKTLPLIAGAKRKMMPLYAAALFGNYEVVKYLYEISNDLCDAGWDHQNRGWLLEKCVLNDMFDVGLKIVKKYPELCSGNVLVHLARKPEAFRKTKSNIILVKNLYSWMFITNQPSENNHQEPGSGRAPEDLDRNPEASSKTKLNILRRTIIALMFISHKRSEYKHLEPGSVHVHKDLAGKAEASPETKSNIIGRIIKPVFAFFGSKVGATEKESEALQLLRIIWGNIAKKPKNEIDRILRGPPDSNMQDKSASGRVVQVLQLQKLISEHLDRMEAETKKIMSEQPDETKKIMSEQPDSTKEDTNPASRKADQALKLKDLISESLVNMHVETQKIIKGAPDSIKQDNKPISGKADEALELQKLVTDYIVNMHNETQKIIEKPGKENHALQLQSVIYRQIDNVQKETYKISRRPAKLTYSSRILFVAAEMGNTKFLVELIHQYPDLIWKVNDNNQTIFHIAVKHRHRGIYNLLYEIGAMKDMITPLKDPQENNMLHLIGKTAKQKQVKNVSGVAFQMQRELLWFHEVKNMIPPSYREQKNEDGVTPHELFTHEHKDLVKKGGEWMKGTANQCMVVAALIATMVFAAAFTVPGGYDQNRGPNIGTPIFDSKATFIVFVVADAISLFSSSAAILMFLAILTSRYAERDFLESLPKKLIIGLATLFLSITTMTVAFGVSFFILYHHGLLWMPILIGVFAVSPALLYILLQYSLFVDVIRSTYGSRYLFMPKKHVLYYKNPNV